MHFRDIGVLFILISSMVIHPIFSDTINPVSSNQIMQSDTDSSFIFPETNSSFSIFNNFKLPSLPRIYRDTLPDGVPRQWIDLSWNNLNNSHLVTIYPPEETLGPFQNIDDGKLDGRIYLEISSNSNLTPGTWHYIVRSGNLDPEENNCFQIYRNNKFIKT